MKTKIGPNLIFEFTIPDCNISIYDNSEMTISRIDDGYSLILVDSNLVAVQDTQPTYNIQHLDIENTNVESKLTGMYFSFRVTAADFDPNITVYSEQLITIHVKDLGSDIVSSNFQITNCNLESDQDLIPFAFHSFELYHSTIPKMKTIKIQGQIATIGFHDLDTTPAIDVSYDFDRGHGEIHLHNVCVNLLTAPELDYVTLENNAKIFSNKIQIKLMKLPILTLFDYGSQMAPATNYILEITGEIVITFQNNNLLLEAESRVITIDTSTETSLYGRLSYHSDLGYLKFVNESTVSSNLANIFYSINEGEYGNVQFDKFTHYIDDSMNINWKFKTITVNSGIIPMHRIILTDSSPYINSNNRELLKLDAITLDSSEISIDSCVYTDFLYIKKRGGLVVHFPSSNSIFDVNHTYCDPVSLVFYSYEGETKPYDDTIKNQCIKSTKNNSFIIDRLNLFLSFDKETVLLKGLIEVKSLYFESSNSTNCFLPIVYGTDCVDQNHIYLNHSLVNDSQNYYYGSECIINLEVDDDNILKDADFKVYPQQVDGKEARIMCMQPSEILAQANIAYTILYLPNQENRGKVIIISLGQFIAIGVSIIVLVLLLICAIFGIVYYRYRQGTLIKND